MNGWCRFMPENESGLIILYSLEDNQKLDGVLGFDKTGNEFSIIQLASGATEELTKHFICAVRGRIRRGYELCKLYYLSVG